MVCDASAPVAAEAEDEHQLLVRVDRCPDRANQHHSMSFQDGGTLSKATEAANKH